MFESRELMRRSSCQEDSGRGPSQGAAGDARPTEAGRPGSRWAMWGRRTCSGRSTSRRTQAPPPPEPQSEHERAETSERRLQRTPQLPFCLQQRLRHSRVRLRAARKPAGSCSSGDSRAEPGDDATGGEVVLDVAFAADSGRADVDTDPAHPVDVALGRVVASRQ